jgi:hypothetical protein
MRKVLASAVTVVLAATTLATVSDQFASAGGTPHCVTKDEFQKVHTGMTRTQVHHLFGIDGSLILILKVGGNVFTQRQYNPCIAGSYVTVSYRNSHETSKSAIWGG